MTLRLLSYNIRYGGSGREESIAAMIRGASPDLVVLQEATRPDVVSRLAVATGMTTWAAVPAHSVGFMSRLDITRHHWHRPPGSRRTYLEIVLAGSGVRIFGIHLSPIHGNWTEQRRVLELQAIMSAIADHRDGFHVLAGDFNTLAPGEKLDLRQLPAHLRMMAMLLGGATRWHTIQIMLDARYVDAFRRFHPQGNGYTFPTWNPHVRIDYVWVPATEAGRLRSCDILDGPLAAKASDHFPLLAEIEL